MKNLKDRESMFYYNIFNSGKDLILAVCDKELLGKKCEEGELLLEVDKNFYNKNMGDGKDIKKYSKKATIINATGERCIRVLIEQGLIEKDNVIKIQGVWHAQMVEIR